MSNAIKTTALLAALTVLFILVGGMIGGEQGMVVALLLAGLMNFAAYWWSDRIVLRMSLGLDWRSNGIGRIKGPLERGRAGTVAKV